MERGGWNILLCETCVFCLWNQTLLLAATSFCNFILSCLPSAFPAPCLDGCIPKSSTSKRGCGLLTDHLGFSSIFSKRKTLCVILASPCRSGRFGKASWRGQGNFLFECCSRGVPEWSEAPSQICDVPGNQSKTSLVCIYFPSQILQYISLCSRWNFIINCILSSPTSLPKLLKLNLTQIHVIPWLFSPTPLFPVGLAGAKS